MLFVVFFVVGGGGGIGVVGVVVGGGGVVVVCYFRFQVWGFTTWFLQHWKLERSNLSYRAMSKDSRPWPKGRRPSTPCHLRRQVTALDNDPTVLPSALKT